MKAWKKSALCSTVAGGLVAGTLGIGSAVAAPNKPEPIEPFSFPFQCTDGPLLDVAVSGKGKLIENPGGVKTISPGFRTTITNPKTGESVTYTITGTVRSEILPNKNIAYRATGRNLIIDPNDDPEVETGELFLTSGNVTFENYPDDTEFIEFSGPGNVTDVCKELA
ncbi:hypothetical protein [Kocuria rosea]|uniref:hypothetical protein n=1 Tax=Kocuria rosea TaxID=1275 RepID=UPI0025B775AA|nr:hypothetical protein [Kocuria rosea]WJZ65510.1 hypothetical protein QR564_12155 [Kocuria rosea]